MNLNRILVLFLGLTFGLSMLYFNSKNKFESKKNNSFKGADLNNSISHQEEKKTLEFKKMHKNITVNSKSNDVSIDSKESNNLNAHLIKKKSDKKPFNYKTDVSFKVIDGYAVAAEDILLGQPLDKTQSQGQTFFNEEVKIWPNAEIPFAFDAKLSPELKRKVLFALDAFSKKTSVQFLEYDGLQKDFIVFSPSDSLCASYVGRVGGPQPILLKANCESSEIQHEIMHALGFIHEHQRDIRDNHLLVFEENIVPEKLINFEILPEPFQNIYRNISLDIDFDSLMIYPSKAFVKSSQLYSLKTKAKDYEIKNNTTLSLGDIENINNLYFRKF